MRNIFRETNISYRLKHTPTCANQGERNVSFSEKFSALTKWMIPNGN